MNVIDGALVWSFKATHGLPLEVVFDFIAQREMVPCWEQLYAAAMKDGADIEKLTRDLMFIIKEAYRPEVAKEINNRLPLMIGYMSR